MATRRISAARRCCNRQPRRQSPPVKSDKFKFLGMYGEVTRHERRLRHGGRRGVSEVLRGRRHAASRRKAQCGFPIEFGFAHTIDTEGGAGRQSTYTEAARRRPKSSRTDHPVFYGYADKIIPDPLRRAANRFSASAQPTRATSLARFVGGDAAVLSGTDGRWRRDSSKALRRRHPRGVSRQGPRHHVREQPGLPLAELRRVQHDVQLDPELERCPSAAARHRARGWTRRTRGRTIDTCQLGT